MWERQLKRTPFWGKENQYPQDPPCHKLGYVHMSCALVTCQADYEPTGLGDSYLCNAEATDRRCYFLLPVWSSGHCPTRRHLEEQRGLSCPLTCLPVLRGQLLQTGLFLAAGQFHFLVDTQQLQNNNKDSLPLKPALPEFIPDTLLCKESSTAPFPF